MKMLTEHDFADQARQLGREVHQHGGVWWEKHQIGYCKPAFEFRPFPPGQARPRFARSFLGYSHQVPDARLGTRVVEYMVLEGEDLKSFSMKSLRSEKRNQVRKGLKSCEVRLITDVEPVLEAMRQINVTQAERQMLTGRFGKPARYYTEQMEAWRAEIRRWFSLPGREWWGAFVNGELGAYMLTFQVETVRFIGLMKTHTDSLKLCLTDAIYFLVLESAAREESCRRIINGGPLRPSLDRYKEQFLFKRTPIPYYTAPVTLVRLGMRLLRLKEAARFKWQCFLGSSRPPRTEGQASLESVSRTNPVPPDTSVAPEVRRSD